MGIKEMTEMAAGVIVGLIIAYYGFVLTTLPNISPIGWFISCGRNNNNNSNDSV